MVDLLFRETRSDQLMIGCFLLVCGMLIWPLMAALVVKAVHALNVATFGPLAAWQLQGLAVLRMLFAITCAFFAALGAVYVSTAFAATLGLIKAPWS